MITEDLHWLWTAWGWVMCLWFEWLLNAIILKATNRGSFFFNSCCSSKTQQHNSIWISVPESDTEYKIVCEFKWRLITTTAAGFRSVHLRKRENKNIFLCAFFAYFLFFFNGKEQRWDLLCSNSKTHKHTRARLIVSLLPASLALLGLASPLRLICAVATKTRLSSLSVASLDHHSILSVPLVNLMLL